MYRELFYSPNSRDKTFFSKHEVYNDYLSATRRQRELRSFGYVTELKQEYDNG
jgi:hypothetical protein